MPTTQEPLTPLEIELLPIPANLRDIPQWGAWRYELQDGKLKKPAFCTKTRKLDPSQPQSWLSLPDAVELVTTPGNNFEGLGFCFGGIAPTCGIDFDHCRNKETGTLAPIERQIIKRLDSYSEVSPSGTGAHTLVNAKLSGRGRRGAGIEVYCEGRYFTVTGTHLEGTPLTVNDRQAVVDNLVNAMPIITKLRTDDTKRATFEALFVGDTGAYGHDESRADLALCSMAAWAGGSNEQIDALMRLSGLYDAKWERADYRTLTIAQARTKTGEAPQLGEKTTPQVGGVVVRLQPQSARDLIEEAIPPVRWVVRDLIPEGLTLLAGGVKLGKSWAALSIGLAVAAGTQVFNYFDTEQGKVLYLALEDYKRRMQGRLDRVCGDSEGPEALQIVYKCPMMPGLLVTLNAWMEDNPDTRLIIIDTLGKVQERVKGSHNAYLTDYDAMGSIQGFALAHGIGVVAVTHTNQKTKKELADPLHQVQSTTGIIGSADTVLILERTRYSNEGTLELASRDISEGIFDVQYDAGLWTVTGRHQSSGPGPKPTARDDAKRLLQEMLATGAQPQTVIAETAEGNGIKPTTLNRAKKDLKIKPVQQNGQWYWKLP
jgi:AAA domain